MSKISKAREKIQTQIEEVKAEAIKDKAGYQEIYNIISVLTNNPVSEEVLERIQMLIKEIDEWEQEELEELNCDIGILDKAEAIIYDWIGD